MPQDYNKTLNLPQTDFSMRASLPQREPDMLKGWEEKQIYQNMQERNNEKPLFILHDGPPFSNGDIHIGTALNKILKDFIVRYKNISGFKSPYVPGWDNHGMPIESAIIKKNNLNRKNMSIPEFRSACHDFAADFVDRQRNEFKRLGVIGDWDHPYLTMDPAFEAEEIRVFGKMYEQGYIYKGMKPVYWCPSDETALAEAEIEYADDPCTTIYVKFQVKDDNGILRGLCDLKNTYFVIWTTTTWTLPGNLAICLGPNFEYSLVKAGSETYILASELVESVCKAAGIGQYEILAKLPGRSFELMTAWNPLYDRDSLIILGDHVTLDTGTGCVHTAPGFGVDDFNICKKYPQIPMLAPVDSHGVMTAEAGQYEGLSYTKANDVIFEDLEKCGALLASEKIVHSYPHCWRCKNPIIFRATEQWFASVDAIKEKAVAACESIEWYPEWGKERMISMIRERSDWCISRQRHWGLPIPVFYCDDCKKPVCTQESIDAVARLFGENGSNAWFETEAVDILPQGFVCPHCGGTHFTKETDTLDGWFDSGSTHAAVLDQFYGLRSPADIYLEGGDQYRGWFQSSMLTSIAAKGEAPYKQIITHGWTVDGEGKAMHKSLGNAVSPDEVINEYGADILRLWVASSDYHSDIRISKDILKQLSEVYRKVRNTARYILSNLYDFDPQKDTVPDDQLLELDRWALTELDQLLKTAWQAYSNYEFHILYHTVRNFCTVEMSNFYLDVIKDRLYVEAPSSEARRSAQTAIYRILKTLAAVLAPILPFTSEEIWSFLPIDEEMDPRSVMYNDVPSPSEAVPDAAFIAKWNRIQAIRDDVNKALEVVRSQKKIGKSLEAKVILTAEDELYRFLESVLGDLATIFIVSDVELKEGTGGTAGDIPGLGITIIAAIGKKCERCWIYSETVGENPEHPTLCARCADVIQNIGL